MHLGCHLSNPNRKIDQVIFTAIELEANAVQIFVNNPNGRAPGQPIPNAEMVKEMLQNTGVFLVIHGKYLYNFCRSLSWQVDGLVADLRIAHSLGPEIGVVIHQGKNRAELKLSPKEARQTYVDNLISVLELTAKINNPILLENSCQQGTEIGFTIEELADIYQRFPPKYRKRIGFCLDTCHIYVAGQLQMKSNQEVDQFFLKWDRLIGLDHLKVIHYNDSKTPFDGHNDHHADIGYGFIGDTGKGGTTEGLRRVLSWAKGHQIPCILETHGDFMPCPEQVKLIRRWGEEVPVVTRDQFKEQKLEPLQTQSTTTTGSKKSRKVPTRKTPASDE